MSHSAKEVVGSKSVYYDPNDHDIEDGIKYLHNHVDSRGKLFDEADTNKEEGAFFTTSNNHKFRIKVVNGYYYLDSKSVY